MKFRWMYPGFFAGAFVVLATFPQEGCKLSPSAAKTVDTVADDTLSVAQLVCVETSSATTVDGLKAVCDGIDKLTPSELNFVIGLLDQKKAAEKVGYTWRKADAGAPVMLPLDGGR